MIKSGHVRCAAVDKEFRYLITAGEDKMLKVWELDGLKLLSERYVFFGRKEMVYEMNTCIANSLKSLLLCNLRLMVKRFSSLINSEIYSGMHVRHIFVYHYSFQMNIATHSIMSRFQ